VVRVPAPVGPTVVKTLKDPPEIWDLVHEAPRDFNPGSAFFARLTSMKTSLTLGIAAVLLVSATGVVGLLLLRGSQASGLQPEQPVTQAATESKVSAPENVQAREVPVSAPAVEVAPTEPVVNHHASELPDATSKPNSPKKVSLTRQSRPRSNASEGIVETAEISETDATGLSRGVSRSLLPAPPATVATPKVETRTPGKPNESVSPQLITPAKTAPKAKVIQWP
jgi:cytoskeletal protein RodZ